MAKEYSGDQEGTEELEFLGALILSSSRFIEQYTGRYFGPSAAITDEIVEDVMGQWRNVIYTNWTPVLSITSLVDDTRTYVEGTDFVLINKRSGKIKLKRVADADTVLRRFSPTTGAVVINYVVGIQSAETETYLKTVHAPANVQLACAMIAGATYLSRDRSGISSRTDGDRTISYTELDIPPKAAALLSREKRPRF